MSTSEKSRNRPSRRFAAFARPIAMFAVWALAATAASADPGNVPIQEPDRAFLGIRMQAGGGVGVVVDGVIPGSAAARAGFQAGDVIVGIGPDRVGYPNHLQDRLAERAPGDLTDVAVLRGGEEIRLDVELGGRAGQIRIDLDGTFTVVSPRMRGSVEGTIHLNDKNELPQIYLCQEDYCRFSGKDRIWYRADCIGRGCPTFAIDYYKRPMLGVRLADKSALVELYPEGDVQGLLVDEVFTGSPADEAEIEAGDVIVSIDDDVIASARDLRQKLDRTSGGAMEIDIVRAGTPLRVRVLMPDRRKR